MNDKPKVVAWMVNYTPFAKESQADIYRAEQQHKQPLIRLSDHEAVREALEVRIAELALDAVGLLDNLIEAAKVLRKYEALHRAKGTADSEAKAEINAELATRFEATIAKAKGES